MNQEEIIKIKILHLKFAKDRGHESTYCPSEVAREFAPNNWRDYMDEVRKVADTMVKDGILVTLQKGMIISEMPSEVKGPIRLRKK